MNFIFEEFDKLTKVKSTFRLEDGKFNGYFIINGMYFDWAEILEMFKKKKMVEAFYNRAIFAYFRWTATTNKSEKPKLKANLGKLSFEGFIREMNVLFGQFYYDTKYAISLAELFEQIPQALFPDFLRAIHLWAEEVGYV